MLVSHLSAHHAQCLKPLNCRCKHNKTFFPKRYFTFLCNETKSKFILKQLDYSPSFSMSNCQLACASLTICSSFGNQVFRFSEQIMSTDKYPSIFSRQMKAIVYFLHKFNSVSVLHILIEHANDVSKLIAR